MPLPSGGLTSQQQAYSPTIGDVVIIVSEGNHGQWPLGRVTKLHPDEEEIVRIVEVVTRGNKLLKTGEKLVPLESATDQDPVNLNIPPLSGRT